MQTYEERRKKKEERRKKKEERVAETFEKKNTGEMLRFLFLHI